MTNNRNAIRYTITRTPAAGGPAAVDSSLEVVKIVESAGASRMDYAEIEVNLAATGTHIAAWSSPPYLGDEIEIEDDKNNIVHWGKITSVEPTISPRGESLLLTSRVELFHMGTPIDRIWMWSKAINAQVYVDAPLVFNPIIDGKAQGNLDNTNVAIGFDSTPLFLNPESVRTTAAQTYQGANAIMWPLSKAIFYLCDSLNGQEIYVGNPPLVTIENLVDDSKVVVSGVSLEKGIYLGEALDRLLNPLGYMWRITRSLGSRTLTFFKRATGGTAVTIKHQVFGATLDIANTNAESTNVRFDAARVTNQMTVRGGFKQYEFTAELARGWDEADDAYTIHELKRSDANFANRKDVFRKWVLNEAGDYIGLRSEITAPFVPTWYGDSDADALIAQLTPLRRRRLLPTLTLADDETPIGNISGVEVEWYNEAEAEWQPIPNWGCELLEHECGIYFASEELPEEFVRPSDLKFRVTATIQSDFAIGYTAPFDVNSPLQDLREAVVYVPDRYQFRQVSPLSKYDSDVNGMTPTRNSLKVDDLVAMTAYADEQKLIWDLLDIGGKVVLEGVDHQSYDVGDRVTKIAGVEVSFEAKTGTARYPQIMAIERNIPSQQTVLHLQRLSPPWGRGR